MGLDITAYPDALLLPAHPFDSDTCYDRDHRRAFCYVGFEASARGLVLDDEADPKTRIRWGRCYQVNERAGFRFAAGSYSGYGDWRERLCVLALGVPPRSVWNAPDRYADQPFYELIRFADNEGTIGPDAAADLAADFAAGRKLVRHQLGHGPGGGWYQGKYDCWQRAFTLAAHHGIVVFH